MFWFWVGVVVVVVLALAAWSSVRAKRIHGNAGVRSQGALYSKRQGLREGDTAQTRSEMQSNRGDQQVMGP